MRQTTTAVVVLLWAGLAGIVVGAGMLFFPIAFHATSGIELGSSANLLNEMRASGGALFAAGGLILAGAFIKKLRFTATLVATLLYLSYGAGRLISLLMDGFPNPALIQIAGFEIVVGTVCAFTLVALHKSRRLGLAENTAFL